MVDLNTGKPWEKVQFIALGKDTSAFEAILHESFAMATLQAIYFPVLIILTIFHVTTYSVIIIIVIY